jgi:hypothetical protein
MYRKREDNMLRTERAHPLRVLVLAAFAALITTLAIPAPPAAAQSILTAPITPVGGSSVLGNLSAAPDNQGNAFITVNLAGLPAGGTVDVNLNAGTCAQPSATVLRLFTLRANDVGQTTANAPVIVPQGTPMPFATLADGNHVVVVIGEGPALACGAVPAAANDLAAALLAEGERQQVMQFNPNAALQKRIFADGFVPNSAEFSTVPEATTFAVQRAEHLSTGAVRAYFALIGD